MENGIDFVNGLDHDMSINILTCLEDISDLVRVSCVSRSWRRHVIENGLCKQMCLRMFPQLSKVDHVLESSCGVKEPAEVGSSNFMESESLEWERRAYAFLAQGCTTFPIRELILEPICASSTDNYPEESIHNTLEPRDRVARRASYCGVKEPAEVGSSNFMKWQSLEREHRAYAFLAHGCTTFPIRELILEPICASSTDNYPEESIHNTLEPRDRVARRASYWSSKGQSNPAVPETLLYKLVGDLCVITEINIQPFQAYFQWGLPIYSAKAVRFRMGHLKFSWDDPMVESCGDSADDKFVWTYTSQEFSMAQENCLQNFKLPEPVLCIGGFLQIELLGRVQRQDIDGLFYICVSHVQIMGRTLSPAFGVEMLEPSEKFALKVLSYTQPNVAEEPPPIPSLCLHRHVRFLGIGQIINILRGNVVDVAEYESDVDDGESDDEFLL